MGNLQEIDYDLQNELIKNQARKVHNSEIVILKDILKTIIKREPGIEDFKKLERRYGQGSDWYRLFYDGKPVGKMEFITQPLKFDDNTMSATQYFNIKFTPDFSPTN